MDVNDRSNVAANEVLAWYIASQHNSVVFLNHRFNGYNGSLWSSRESRRIPAKWEGFPAFAACGFLSGPSLLSSLRARRHRIFSHSIRTSKPKTSAKRCSTPLRLFENAPFLSPLANEVPRRQRSLARSRYASESSRPRRASCSHARPTSVGRHPDLRTGHSRRPNPRICRHGLRRATRRSHRAEAFSDPVPRAGEPQARRVGAHASLEPCAIGGSAGERQHPYVRTVTCARTRSTDQQYVDQRVIDSPTGTARHDPSPLDWAHIWAHEFSNAANRSGNSTFRGVPSLPWAQGSLARIQSPDLFLPMSRKDREGVRCSSRVPHTAPCCASPERPPRSTPPTVGLEGASRSRATRKPDLPTMSFCGHDRARRRRR